MVAAIKEGGKLEDFLIDKAATTSAKKQRKSAEKRSNMRRHAELAKWMCSVGLPPEKWSSLMYGLWPDGGLKNGKEATHG